MIKTAVNLRLEDSSRKSYEETAENVGKGLLYEESSPRHQKAAPQLDLPMRQLKSCFHHVERAEFWIRE